MRGRGDPSSGRPGFGFGEEGRMNGLHQINIVNGSGVFVGFVRVSDGEAELLLSALESVGGDDVEIGLISGGETAVVVKRGWKPHTLGTVRQNYVPVTKTVSRLQREAMERARERDVERARGR